MANLSNINNKFLVTTGGNVGINTTSPGEKLEVAGNVGVNGFITHNGDSGTFMGWSADDTNVFYTAGNERLRIDASGNVGIGTDSPNFTLDVEADKDTWISRIYNTGSDANAQSLLIRSDATSAHDASVMGVYADSGYKMVVRSTGNVGIGETNPDTKLHIKSSTYDDFIKLERDGIGAMGISATNPRGIQTTDGAGGFLGWHVNSSGNVGIGTFSPGGIFEVFQQSTGRTRGDLLVDAGAKYVYVGRLSTTSGDVSSFKVRDRLNRAYFDVNTASKYISFNPEVGDITMQIASGYGFKVNGGQFNVNATSGNVGIGTTSPAQPVHLLNGGFAYMRFTSQGYGATGFDIGQHTNGNIYLNNRDNTAMVFMTNNTERMNILAGGTGTFYNAFSIQGDDKSLIVRNAAGTVIGTMGAESSSTPNVGMTTIRNNGTTTIQFNSNGSSYINGGNVGIGTTSPTYPLTLSGGAANTNPGTVEAPYIGEELAFKIENTGWTSTNGLIRMIQPAGAYVNNASMTFSTLQGSLTEKMRIENNGNVGIGTISPSSKLHVVGGATNSQHIVRGPYTVGLSGNSLGNATFTAAFNFNGFYNTGYTIEVYALFNHWNSSTANYTYCYRKALLFGYNAAGAAQIDGPGGGVSNSVNVGAWTFSVDNNGVTGYAQRILATKSAGNAAWHGTYWIQIVSSVPLDPLDVS